MFIRLRMAGWVFRVRRVAAAAAVVVLAAGTVAAAGGPAAAANAPVGPVLAFTPAAHYYWQVSSPTDSQTFTLANSGGKASGKLAVTVGGAAQFTVTADTCTGTSLKPGRSCTVTVQFAPADSELVTATLTAASKKTVLTSGALTGTGLDTAALDLCHSYGGVYGDGPNLTFGGWPYILWTCNGWAVEPGVDQYHALGNACIAGGGTGYGASVGDTSGNFTCGHS